MTRHVTLQAAVTAGRVRVCRRRRVLSVRKSIGRGSVMVEIPLWAFLLWGLAGGIFGAGGTLILEALLIRVRRAREETHWASQ